jgi:predicted nucleic acid-binding Zn ribbon protein
VLPSTCGQTISRGQWSAELEADADQLQLDLWGAGTTTRACSVCGVALDDRRPDAIYCSATCRSAARDLERAERRFDSDRAPCPVCGEPMAGRRLDAVYCSAVCRARAWAERHQRPVKGNGSGRSGEAVQKRSPRPAERVALTRAEAAGALGISLDSFERHVQPKLRIVRVGRTRLVPVRELERWTKENAALTLSETIR